MWQRAIICTVLNMLATGLAQACFVPPRGVTISAYDHLAQARDVSVAGVVRATPLSEGAFSFEFEVVKRLMGPDASTFSVIGTAERPGADAIRAVDHSDKLYLQTGGGRLHNDPDCVIRPSFAVGKTYLAFKGQPVTHLSFEEIRMVDGAPDAGDHWLAYVQARLPAAQR